MRAREAIRIAATVPKSVTRTAWLSLVPLCTAAAWAMADSPADAGPGLLRCRAAAMHGQAQIQIAETKRLVDPAKGSPHYCRAELVVSGPAYEERRVYVDIDPLGGPYGVGLLPEPIGPYRAIAKLGDYDGRLLLVDVEGRVIDLPGPQYLIAYGAFLILRHRTDAALSIVVFSLLGGRTMFAAVDASVANLFDGHVEVGRLEAMQWLESGGQVYAWLPATASGSRGLALRLDGRRGVLVRAQLSAEQVANAHRLAYRGLEDWEDCSCGAGAR